MIKDFLLTYFIPGQKPTFCWFDNEDTMNEFIDCNDEIQITGKIVILKAREIS